MTQRTIASGTAIWPRHIQWRDTVMIIVAIATIYLPLSLFYAPDIRIFLVPWLVHIRGTGPISAFAHPFSNYTPPTFT